MNQKSSSSDARMRTHLRWPAMTYSPRSSLSKPYLMTNERKKLTPSGVERAIRCHSPSSEFDVNVSDVARSCSEQTSGKSQPAAN